MTSKFALGGLTFLLSALLMVTPTAASLLTRCGESKGWSYFFEGGFVGPGQGGWREDGISGGAIEVHLKNDVLDVIFYDTTGGPYSHTSEGAQVYPTSIQETESGGRTFTVVVDNRGTGLLETYFFNLNATGSGTVVWSAMRSGGILPKASLMTASCSSS